MQRPDLATLACVNAECQLFRRTGANNLVIRKVYGHDSSRLLRCRPCGEEFSEQRGAVLFNTKITESKLRRSSITSTKAVRCGRWLVWCGSAEQL